MSTQRLRPRTGPRVARRLPEKQVPTARCSTRSSTRGAGGARRRPRRGGPAVRRPGRLARDGDRGAVPRVHGCRSSGRWRCAQRAYGDVVDGFVVPGPPSSPRCTTARRWCSARAGPRRRTSRRRWKSRRAPHAGPLGRRPAADGEGAGRDDGALPAARRVVGQGQRRAAGRRRCRPRPAGLGRGGADRGHVGRPGRGPDLVGDHPVPVRPALDHVSPAGRRPRRPADPVALARHRRRRLDAAAGAAGDQDADVAVVGAGFTGLWTAYYLLRPTRAAVAVLEREIAGFGACGRNGGWCSALFPAPLGWLAKRYGGRRPRYRAMHRAVDEVGAVAAGRGDRLRLRQGRRRRPWHAPRRSSPSASEAPGRPRRYGSATTFRCSGPEEARPSATRRRPRRDVHRRTRGHPPGALVRGLAGPSSGSAATCTRRQRSPIEPGRATPSTARVRAEVVVRPPRGTRRASRATSGRSCPSATT